MKLRHDEIQCRGCYESREDNPNKVVEIRYDAYGISTGHWCEECYDSNKYPYRRDKYYDYLNAGEYMDDDY
jgi:hypothetical protein